MLIITGVAVIAVVGYLYYRYRSPEELPATPMTPRLAALTCDRPRQTKRPPRLRAVDKKIEN